MSLWIKICGTTNLDDARTAIDAGADALGFIFAPSPRRISPRDAARIIEQLPKRIERIGVFVNQAAELILDTADKAGLTGVQLHGDEDVGFARKLLKDAAKKERRLRIIKTVSLANGSLEKTAAFEDGAEEIFDTLLLDSGTAAKRGGTGTRFDWQSAAPMVRFVAKKFKIVAAGGLNAATVADAVRLLDPWGVDVVSGVEREPGKKDPVKVREFIAAARQAELHGAGQKQK